MPVPTWNSENSGGPARGRCCSPCRHHAIRVAEGEGGLIGLVADGLGDAVELQQACLVELASDGATQVGDIGGGVAGSSGLDLNGGDNLLDLGEQGSLEKSKELRWGSG
jgi:hypothetical protein